jgi:hypothetical protein
LEKKLVLMARKKRDKLGEGIGGIDAPAGIEGDDLDVLKALRAKRKTDLEELDSQEDDS